MIQKTLILGFFVSCTSVTFAQVPLQSMSARAKAKLAKQEDKAAEKDALFQNLMQEGKELFETKEFDEALAKFELAKAQRPYNVYPSVMIDDVKLAMEDYVEPNEDSASITEDPLEEREELPIAPDPELLEAEKRAQEQRLKEAYAREMEKVEKESPPAAEQINEISAIDDAPAPLEPTEAQKTDAEGMIEFHDEDPQVMLAEEFPDGVTEEEFKEGNKTIVRRVVVKDGIASDYRKVIHAWGGVFYFKNGESVTLRTWNEETVLN